MVKSFFSWLASPFMEYFLHLLHNVIQLLDIGSTQVENLLPFKMQGNIKIKEMTQIIICSVDKF